MVLTSHGITLDDWLQCHITYLQGRLRKTWFDCPLIRAVALSKFSLKQNPLKEKGALGSPCYLFKALPHSKVSRLKIWSFAPNDEIPFWIPAWDRLQWELEGSRCLHAVKWPFWDYQSSKLHSVNKHQLLNSHVLTCKDTRKMQAIPM